MHTDSLYTRLWTVADKDLPNAFVALETALRGFLLDDIQKSFTTFIENFHFDRQTHDIRIEEEGYQFFQYCLDAYKSAYKLQWLNPASLQWKKDIQYIEGDKDEEVQASPIWRLFPGQKKRWLHSPHLQEQMEHVIACYKLELEQLVHTYRDVISAIVHEPIEILSSVIEEKPTELPTAEVLNRMANELTNPKEKYIAKAKLATTEYTLTAPDLPPRVSEKEYTDRKKNILENTRREHMKLREDIDREIKERHARLTEPEPKLHAKHEEEIIPPEEPRKKARTEE